MNSRMTPGELRKIRKLVPQLESFQKELSSVAQGRPTDALSKPLVEPLDHLFSEAVEILGDDYRPFPSFERVPREGLSLSEAVVLLAQFIACFQSFTADRVVKASGRWSWVVGDPTDPGEPVYVPVDGQYRPGT